MTLLFFTFGALRSLLRNRTATIAGAGSKASVGVLCLRYDLFWRQNQQTLTFIDIDRRTSLGHRLLEWLGGVATGPRSFSVEIIAALPTNRGRLCKTSDNAFRLFPPAPSLRHSLYSLAPTPLIRLPHLLPPPVVIYLQRFDPLTALDGINTPANQHARKQLSTTTALIQLVDKPTRVSDN